MIPKDSLWKAIRHKCLDCMANQVKEIRLCTNQRCALWPYRMGRRGIRAETVPQTMPILPKTDRLAG